MYYIRCAAHTPQCEHALDIVACCFFSPSLVRWRAFNRWGWVTLWSIYRTAVMPDKNVDMRFGRRRHWIRWRAWVMCVDVGVCFCACKVLHQCETQQPPPVDYVNTFYYIFFSYFFLHTLTVAVQPLVSIRRSSIHFTLRTKHAGNINWIESCRGIPMILQIKSCSLSVNSAFYSVADGRPCSASRGRYTFRFLNATAADTLAAEASAATEN